MLEKSFERLSLDSSYLQISLRCIYELQVRASQHELMCS